MTTEIIPFNIPHDLETTFVKPPALFLLHDKAAERFWEFFAANIRNKNTRRAYYRAACRFSDWCDGRGLFDLTTIKPIHVAAFIEELQTTHSKPTVKQHLAALRMLFDWLRRPHSKCESGACGARAQARRQERQDSGPGGR
jgi:site-specific recombinase XerD